MTQLKESRPILYKMAQPTELQITCFLKSNAKLVKDALLMKAAAIPTTPPLAKSDPVVVINCEEDQIMVQDTVEAQTAAMRPVLK